MAQFIAFDEEVEVNGRTIYTIVGALEIGKEYREEILAKHGIVPEPDTWHSQQLWLDAFKEIAETIGQNTLFMIGKAIPEHADFPPGINNLEQALKSIDVAYHMNHRNGEIGHYQLTHFDKERKEATMVCNTPYPSEFDRGIITSMLRQFRPANSFRYDVILDISKETRIKGGESCTYKIVW
ncbi:MAG: hypothetical protein ACPGJS_05620 [Flammeovirgaceae bacterium]